MSGSVNDSMPAEPDLVYSSDPAVVRASWDGFADHESGLHTGVVDIKHQRLGKSYHHVYSIILCYSEGNYYLAS